MSDQSPLAKTTTYNEVKASLIDNAQMIEENNSAKLAIVRECHNKSLKFANQGQLETVNEYFQGDVHYSEQTTANESLLTTVTRLLLGNPISEDMLYSGRLSTTKSQEGGSKGTKSS